MWVLMWHTTRQARLGVAENAADVLVAAFAGGSVAYVRRRAFLLLASYLMRALTARQPASHHV